MSQRNPPPFDPGTVVRFKNVPPYVVVNSDGPKRIRSVRWVNKACESGYLIDVEELNNPQRQWIGYDSGFFEVDR